MSYEWRVASLVHDCFISIGHAVMAGSKILLIYIQWLDFQAESGILAGTFPAPVHPFNF